MAAKPSVGARAAERMRPAAKRAAKHLAAAAAREASVPVIYVNDNFGRWRSDFHAIVDRCTREGCPGRDVARLLAPDEADYFVLKPMNSGFYSTVLETLLRHLGARRLVLGGFATDNCILFTAHDAHMRGYDLVVPADCTAGTTPAGHRRALEQIRRQLHGDTRPSQAIDWRRLRRTRGESAR